MNQTPLPGYKHPSESAYLHGCKCEPCLARRRRTKKLREIYGSSMTDATQAIQKVRQLINDGCVPEHIARLCGTDSEVIRDLNAGLQSKVLRRTANRLQTLTLRHVIDSAGDLEMVSPVGAQRRVHALRRMGWPMDVLAGGDQKLYDTIRRVSRGANKLITAGTHRRIVTLYDLHAMTVGPSTSTAKRAAAKGLHPPLAWDEDIDDPAAQPNYGQVPDESNTRMDLYHQGLSDGQIGAAVGVSTDAIQKWRTRRNLPSNYYTREGRAS